MKTTKLAQTAMFRNCVHFETCNIHGGC